jgi:hypothetical protein
MIPAEKLERLKKLEKFYKTIIELTEHHEVVNGCSVVFPYKLGEALSKVNPGWYEKKEK